MRVYLGGAITGCTDAECKDWRNKFKEIVSSRKDIEILDPMDRDFRGREAECYKEIVDLDKQDIDRADVLVVRYLPDLPQVGTSMEILHAWGQHKRIIILLTPNVKEYSPWLQYHSHEFVSSLEEAAACL